MLSFKQYLLESTGGNYVSLDVDDPEIELNLDSGKIVPPGKHHVTLMYSEGTSVPPEKIKTAIEWMTKAAQRSEGNAERNMESQLERIIRKAGLAGL